MPEKKVDILRCLTYSKKLSRTFSSQARSIYCGWQILNPSPRQKVSGTPHWNEWPNASHWSCNWRLMEVCNKYNWWRPSLGVAGPEIPLRFPIWYRLERAKDGSTFVSPPHAPHVHHQSPTELKNKRQPNFLYESYSNRRSVTASISLEEDKHQSKNQMSKSLIAVSEGLGGI